MMGAPAPGSSDEFLIGHLQDLSPSSLIGEVLFRRVNAIAE